MPESRGGESDDEEEITELNKKDFRVLISGIVLKQRRIGLFYNKRILTITNQPKIYYVGIDNVYKGEIPITPELKAEVKSGKKFVIKAVNKDYNLKDMTSNPTRWVECVNTLVQEIFG